MVIKVRGNTGSPKMEKLAAKGSVVGVKKLRKILGIPPKVKVSKAKPIVSLRIDPEILDYFRGTGPLWQTRMIEVLRNYVEAQKGGEK